ncbi:hypothetical protein UPYG_G00333760 [Umbra pygmaea]|uniref:Uncharacterized protein n=1 Tax=Umbra pygmaea TaxID=75934 RepID=A0ABD0WA50_UMBPY
MMAAMVETRTALPSESLNDISSDDDEPLIVLLRKSQTNNKTKSENELSKNITRKDSGLDDTSDDEPLTKWVKRPKKTIAQEKSPQTTNIKRVAGSTQEEESHDSSDDEPLINMVKNSNKQTSLPFKKRPFTGQGQRNCNKGRNKVQKTNAICTDSSSSDNSDDMPLNEMVDRLKKATRKKTLSTTRESPDIRKRTSSDDSSDYEPIINLSRRSQSPEKKRKAQKQFVTKESIKHGRQTKKTTSSEEEITSDDEPLIRFVKKPLTAVKTTSAASKTKSTSGKMVPRKMIKPKRVNKKLNRCHKVVKSMSEGSSYDSSDDELLNRKTVRNPPMKNLMVILERCDTNEDLEDNCEANLGNTGEISAGIEENSSDEQLIKMVANPPPFPKPTAAETNNPQVSSDDEALLNIQ